MKIAIAQLNFHIGNFEYNKELIFDHITKAKKDDADLIVFSEVSVCGYPPQDLLAYKGFIDECDIAVKEIASHCKGIAAIIGSPRFNPSPKGKPLLNSAFFLNEGKIQFVQNKTLLPTYDIFDEYRYFEPNNRFDVVEYKGYKIAVTICEDLWDDQPENNIFGRRELYTLSPMEKLKDFEPDILINISASPFSYSKIWGKKNVFLRKAKQYNIPVFMVNQVGAQTELIFEGASLVVHPTGTVVDELKWFKEDYRAYELDKILKSEVDVKHHSEYDLIEKIHDALVLGLEDFFGKLNFKKAVLGLSGGIDSAVALVIAKRALGRENLRVLIMPSEYSSEDSVTDAKKLAENLGINYDILPIDDIKTAFSETLEPVFKDIQENTAEENIQARIRGTLLMAISNKFGNILLNTSNKSESAVGYTTLYGDMTGAVSILGDVYKTDVYKLAEYLNMNEEIIPENIVNKTPSAELRPNQKDSDSLPDYEVLDKILFEYIELQKSVDDIVADGQDEALVRDIINMVNLNEYKRFQAPPVLRISSKAFGMGRRMPLVARYQT
ncbi:MAG: NAD+ synthase [Bacteroidales bacterium]